MKNKRSKIKNLGVTLVVAFVVALGGLLVAKTTQAQDSGSYPPIIQKLVERFNLDAGEVQEVFDEARQERHQEMQSRFEERLDKMAAAGEITAEQKEAILAKKAEMRAGCEGMKDISPEERRAKMQEHREEMEAWAEENGIDLAQIGPFGRGFRGRGFGHFGPKL